MSKDIQDLIERFRAGTCSENELARIDAWYEEIADVECNLSQAEIENLEESMFEVIQQYVRKKRHTTIWSRITVAASILLCMGSGYYFFQKNNRVLDVQEAGKYIILPGGNKAILTLSNGKRIDLNTVKSGEISLENGIKLTKPTDGKLVYTELNKNGSQPKNTNYNTIEVPKGGQYKVQLPDGSNVWLNAASTLKYPVSFSSLHERKVVLNGEAYFEVAKDKLHPFIVQSKGQEVKVLGTHFNINSYDDEEDKKTTLLEGSVKITLNQETRILRPGQQANVGSNSLNITPADTSQVIAWTRNKFVFDNSDISYIMRMISRWYNVEVTYEGSKPISKFNGSISRFENVSDVLKSLELTKKVHFKINGRRIIVAK